MTNEKAELKEKLRIDVKRFKEQGCPQCHNKSGVKIIRNGDIYCEDCGWPDQDFAAV